MNIPENQALFHDKYAKVTPKFQLTPKTATVLGRPPTSGSVGSCQQTKKLSKTIHFHTKKGQVYPQGGKSMDANEKKNRLTL